MECGYRISVKVIRIVVTRVAWKSAETVLKLGPQGDPMYVYWPITYTNECIANQPIRSLD